MISQCKIDQFKKNLEHLIWLKAIGIDHYCYDNKKIDYNLAAKLLNVNNNINCKNNAKNQDSKKEKTLEIIKNNSQDEASNSRKLVDNISTLDQLRNEVKKFTGCKLKNFALNTVFADGNPKSKVMLIGEAPGANEDKYGIPFCGESGKLLDKMLASIGLSRKNNAYITNTVFWRPPANRAPTNEEIKICKPFVEKHIALINPKLIILVGNTAINSLLNESRGGISHIRNNYYQYSNIYINYNITTTAIFHPAYLLRQPKKKKEAWFNLMNIQHYLKEIL